MIKWFSFDEKIQRTEEITPSEEVFSNSSLLFWRRGLEEWVKGDVALKFFLNPVIEKVVQEPIQEELTPIEKKEVAPSSEPVKENAELTSIKAEPIDGTMNILKHFYPKRKVPKRKDKKIKISRKDAEIRAFKAAYSQKINKNKTP